MKKILATAILIVTLVMTISATVSASPEQGVFCMHETNDVKIVATERRLIAAPRQAVYVYSKYGVTDASGNFIVEPVYDSISPLKEERALFYKDGKYGFFDQNWNVAIEPVYKSAVQFSEGLACAVDDTYKYGFIDKNGEVAIPFVYERAGSFSGGTAEVGSFVDGYNFNKFYKSGKIDKAGNIVEPMAFKHEESYDVIMSENNININGKMYTNSELEYPFINYLGYTYIPLTYYGCREMGFSCTWSAETGLVLKNVKEQTGSILGKNSMKRGEYFKASVYQGKLTVGGVEYTASDVYYPLLFWNDIVYMPVLWRQGMEALGLNYSYDLDSRSLVINIK